MSIVNDLPLLVELLRVVGFSFDEMLDNGEQLATWNMAQDQLELKQLGRGRLLHHRVDSADQLVQLVVDLTLIIINNHQ